MKKFKRLNRKGFTLIELLAVIVILAIVMGIAANSVLTSINNSRKSSLYSAAQNAANTLNNWATEDAMVSSANQKVLGDDFINALGSSNTNKWVCLNTGNVAKIVNRDANGAANTSLLTALGLSDKDIVVSTEATKPPTDAGAAPVETGNASAKTCSAIRYNSSFGGYELLLVARSGGKFYVTTDTTHYAYNRATAENKPLGS